MAAAGGDAGAIGDAPAAKRQRVALEQVQTADGLRNIIEVDGKGCTHEVAWPAGQEGSPLPPPRRPGPPAREYPFALDPFQRVAVDCLEAGHSVLVAAHTSAGKTAVAEYAFGMALRDGARVVYTSPLKALSNQKYREFAERLGDVGLLTGDVAINAGASCLVMTTEILRSMLYNGSPVVREASLLVFDEIHYLRDAERGVVWEECIALAPAGARFAFLSATLPNAREFAEWVASVHGSPCHVVYTDYRPVPLQHYLLPAGGDGLHLVVDERGAFREDAFRAALAELDDAGGEGRKNGGGSKSGAKGGGGAAGGAPSDIFRLATMCMERRYDPVIVFSFSKRECEALAAQMAPLELNSDAERRLVDGIYAAAVDALGDDDRRLPQVTALLPALRRGVGVHHSGMLPILKEVTEILFQEGLLKLLFATETFSTGLNMPAKTVVFTHARKFDGGAFRWVSPGEYTQMAGRAGRRGLDDRGVVVLMLDARLDAATARGMLRGAPDALRSEFHLRYSSLLALARGGGGDRAAEELLRRSFRQFQAARRAPALEAAAAAAEAAAAAVDVPGEPAVTEYAALLDQAARLRGEARAAALAPRHALPFLQPGRLARVLPPGAARGDPDAGVWAAVVNFERAGRRRQQQQQQQQQQQPGAGGGGPAAPGAEGGAAADAADADADYIVDVLVNVAADGGGDGGGATAARRPVPLPPGAPGGAPQVVPVPLAEVAELSSLRVYIPRDLRPAEARAAAARALAEVERRFTGDGRRVPLLDPEDDMKVGGKEYRRAARRLEAVEALLGAHALAGAPDLGARLAALRRKQALAGEARAARREARAARGLVLEADLKARRRVLRRLGCVDAAGLVSVKGRLAAEISTGDELVLAELALGGALGELPPAELAALLSCFVWRERAEAGAKLPPRLEAPFAALRDAARRVARAEADAGLPVDADEYAAGFRPELVDAVLAWAGGAPFAAVMKTGPRLFEGSLVRAIRRLEELLRQLAAALRGVGDAALAERCDAAIAKIKRDVVFAASLFL